MSICGAGVHDCQLLCDFNDNADSFYNIVSIVNYCYYTTQDTRPLSESNCIKYYLPNCQLYIPPSSSSFASSSSGNGNDFDFSEVNRGFKDFNDIFVLIFACFLLVKLIWMAK